MGVTLETLSTNIIVSDSGNRITLSIPGLLATWGTIGGTLSDQTDLQAALDGKANKATVQTVSSATVTHAANDSLHVLDTSSNAITDNLAAASLWTGRTLNIKKTSALNKVTINPDGAELIDGAVTFEFFNDNESISIMSDGVGVHIV